MRSNLEKERWAEIHTETKKTISQLTSKVSYLEGQSKRDNLVFFGIPKQEEETWDDCEDEVREPEVGRDSRQAWKAQPA